MTEKFEKVVEWNKKENEFISYPVMASILLIGSLIINASTELTYSRLNTSSILFGIWIFFSVLIFFSSHERKVYWRKIR